MIKKIMQIMGYHFIKVFKSFIMVRFSQATKWYHNCHSILYQPKFCKILKIKVENVHWRD
jgi:hypothetical protein